MGLNVTVGFQGDKPNSSHSSPLPGGSLSLARRALHASQEWGRQPTGTASELWTQVCSTVEGLGCAHYTRTKTTSLCASGSAQEEEPPPKPPATPSSDSNAKEMAYESLM